MPASTVWIHLLVVNNKKAATSMPHDCAGTALRQVLEEASLREGREPAARNDKMVERADIDERQCLLQRLRQQLIGTRGFGDARRMVVREDHRCRIACERRLDDFARINAGLRQRSAKQ